MLLHVNDTCTLPSQLPLRPECVDAEVRLHPNRPIDPDLAFLHALQVVLGALWRASLALLDNLENPDLPWRDGLTGGRLRVCALDGGHVGCHDDGGVVWSTEVGPAAISRNANLPPLNDVASANRSVALVQRAALSAYCRTVKTG